MRQPRLSEASLWGRLLCLLCRHNDELSEFSCYEAQTVHLAAPGEYILSTMPGNTTGKEKYLLVPRKHQLLMDLLH